METSEDNRPHQPMGVDPDAPLLFVSVAHASARHGRCSKRNGLKVGVDGPSVWLQGLRGGSAISTAKGERKVRGLLWERGGERAWLRACGREGGWEGGELVVPVVLRRTWKEAVVGGRSASTCSFLSQRPFAKPVPYALKFLTAANMSHLSGGQLLREALAKVRVATGFTSDQVLYPLNMGDPALPSIGRTK